MVNGRREGKKREDQKRKHTLKNDSHDFYCFKKRWMVLMR